MDDCMGMLYLECFERTLSSLLIDSSSDPSSGDPTDWLGAQDAAGALCCGSWEGLGVGQGWHGQCNVGKVGSLWGFLQSPPCKAALHELFYAKPSHALRPIETWHQCSRIDPCSRLMSGSSESEISTKCLLWMEFSGEYGNSKGIKIAGYLFHWIKMSLFSFFLTVDIVCF